MRSLALALLGLLLAAAALAEAPVPSLDRPVTDTTGTLGPSQRSALERKLEAFAARKGSRIAVLIVPTTAAETIEQYSIRVAEAARLGRTGIDDGAILLVAKNDRTLRIEVGYGLEGVLPDAIASRIVNEVIVPRFRAGDFAGGVDAGVDAMIAVVDGEPLPPPEPPRSRAVGGDTFQVLVVMGFIAVVVGGGILRPLIGPLPAALVTGGIVGAIAWLVVASILVGLLAGSIAFVATLAGAAAGIDRGRRRRTGGGWIGGGDWSSGGGWSGSAGGGWGGGGGGFGGGGASGRW